MHLLHELFNYSFWAHEAVALRNTLVEVLRVLVIYLLGRLLINVAARRIATAAVDGPRRLGLLQHAAAEARLRTLIGMTRSIGLYVLFFVCTILLLRALDFDAISVVTSASVAGIAVGLGAQKLFRDVISGFFIILENQYVIGDYVTINGIVTGRVEEMGMRIVKLRDDSGKLTIFANGDITQVCNQSRGAVSSTIDFGVPPGTDLGKMRQLVDVAGQEIFEQRKEELGLVKAPTLLGVVGGDSMRTVARAAVQVEEPTQLAATGLAVHDAIYAKLLANGITPF